MYFNNIEKFNMEENITNLDKIYAHLREEDKKVTHTELLKEHSELSLEYFFKIVDKKNLDGIFLNFQKNFFNGFSEKAIIIWKELMLNTIYMHDTGKMNPSFQKVKMRNDNFKMTYSRNTNHSIFSSVIYFNHYFNKLMEMKMDIKKDEISTLFLFLILNAFIISKHHGNLNNFKDFIEELKKKVKDDKKEETSNYKNESSIKIDLNKQFNKILAGKIKIEPWIVADLYIYIRFMFGLLVSSDFYATSHYQNNKEVDNFGVIDNVNKYFDIFKDTDIYKSINYYKGYLNGDNKNPFDELDINELRSKIFIESEENLIKNIDKDIFFLEAPTGSGKTNSSLNITLNIIKNNQSINKIFYVFPFNTLVEQTKESLFNTFNNFNEIKDDIAIINSITPIKLSKDDDEYNEYDKINYEKSLLSRQFLHYPIVITTHVNMFNYLFGNGKEDVFPLAQIANSVIVLDEIQSYKNSIWKEIIVFLKSYARLLNIKILIMSATLPDLAKISYEKNGFTRLISNSKEYFENKLFRDRVKIDFSMIKYEKDEIKEKLIDKIVEISKRLQDSDLENKILVEFIKKKTAIEFFNDIKECDLGLEVLLITGDDNKVERKRIIDQIKKGKNILLISTQVIEAGVDIDMDIGFKDVSILDSEEQFLGRINRSCKKTNCKVYFFNLDDASTIYKNDIRKIENLTLKNENMQHILEEKEFDKFYDEVLIKLEQYKNSTTHGVSIEEFRKESLNEFNFFEIKKRLELISDDRYMYTVFLNRTINDINGESIKGSDVWSEYKEVLTNNSLKYAERKVKLSQIVEKLDYFTYQIDDVGFSYNDILGNMIYIENGDKYFENGKFNKELLQKSNACEFISD